MGHTKQDWTSKAEARQALRSVAYLTSPLWLEHGHIRLLKLQPGQAKDYIRCSLYRTSLDSTPAFEALSYTWGSTNNGATILLDGFPATVTRNLFEALRGLRQQRSPRVLWIDAFCINQHDTVERGEQVQQMTRIYQAAWRVVVWLGLLVSENARAALDVLQTWPASRKAALEGGTDLLLTIESETKQPGYWPYMNNKQLHGVLEILQCSWWRRAWVVQEITVAKEVVVGCITTADDRRPDFFPWAMLRDIKEHVMRAVWNNFDGDVFAFAIATMPYGSMLRLREQAMYAGPQCLPLGDLLRLGQDFDTSDPMDKVFALVGLASDLQPGGVNVDYSRTTQEVYMNATIAACHAGQSLDILTMDIQAIMPGLPSWAKDFSAPLKQHVMWNGGIASLAALHYEASGGMPPIMRPRRVEGELRLDGIRIDRISKAIPLEFNVLSYDSSGSNLEHGDVCAARDSHVFFGPDGLESATPSMHFHLQLVNFIPIFDLHQRVQLDAIHSKSDSSSSCPNQLSSALWKILCGQRGQTGEEDFEIINDGDTSSNDVYKACASPDYDPFRLMHPSRFYQARKLLERYACFALPPLRAALGRSFFVTENGHVGLCPQDAQTGDLIAVMYGASIPFVLRDGGGGAQAGMWKVLIGGCYVEGFMSGEALDLSASAQESFTLR